MPRLTLYAEARKIRLDKGLTQADAAKMFGKSPSYIARIENGDLPRETQRKYRDMLQARRANRRRTPGGKQKAGRISVGRTVAREMFRGDPLMPGFDHAGTLPQNSGWAIQGICRSGTNVELAFLYDEETDLFGIVGFHKIDGVIKRGRIIMIESEYAEMCDRALIAFAKGNIGTERASSEAAAPSRIDPDEGLLADDIVNSETIIKRFF